MNNMNNKYIFILPQTDASFKKKSFFRGTFRALFGPGEHPGKSTQGQTFPFLLNHTCYFFVKRCGNFRRCAETSGKKLL